MKSHECLECWKFVCICKPVKDEDRCYARLAFPGYDSRYSIPKQCRLRKGHNGRHEA